jgi:hypothetical protein
MATALSFVELPPAIPLRRWNLREYHRMIELGFLTEDDRVELLEGWIVAKMPHNPPHDSTISTLNRLFVRLLSDDWAVRCQCAVTLRAGRGSEPEPDLLIARGPDDRYANRHPGPMDTALVIEVSDTTIDHDRGFKQQVYARARLPIYWVVNVVDQQIEVYTLPRSGRNPKYLRRKDYQGRAAVPFILFDTAFAEIPANSILPHG